MSRKYKFYNKEGLYFISFATVNWVDVFVRDEYFAVVVDSLNFCRREWILWMMERAGIKNSNVKKRQFWQQHNNPIELWTPAVIDQKADYIHENPVVAGFVIEAEQWKYSSAIDYSGGKGVMEIDFI